MPWVVEERIFLKVPSFNFLCRIEINIQNAANTGSGQPHENLMRGCFGLRSSFFFRLETDRGWWAQQKY